MRDKSLFFNNDILILGNQSADLDSTVSALALATLLERINPGIKVKPLLQGHPADLGVKPEIVQLLKRAGIELSPPHFTSFYEKEESIRPGTALILVDHNVAEVLVNHPVTGIIDHHRDEGFHRDTSFRMIKSCGSCASLITSCWEEQGEPIPHETALILAAAIAVDTGYLNPEWGKTKEIDRLQYRTLSSSLSEDDIAFLNRLLEIKNDPGGLSPADHLKRDYKTFPLENIRGGISSLLIGQDDFFNPLNYSHGTVRDFTGSYCPDFLILMHSLTDPLRRELSLFCVDRTLRESLSRSLLSLESSGLKPAIQHSREDLPHWLLFSQDNPVISRKVLVPLLKDELEKNRTIQTIRSNHET